MKIKLNQKSQKIPTILAPDLLGNYVIGKQLKISKKNNLLVLHDSADTLGATIDRTPVESYTDYQLQVLWLFNQWC